MFTLIRHSLMNQMILSHLAPRSNTNVFLDINSFPQLNLSHALKAGFGIQNLQFAQVNFKSLLLYFKLINAIKHHLIFFNIFQKQIFYRVVVVYLKNE